MRRAQVVGVVVGPPDDDVDDVEVDVVTGVDEVVGPRVVAVDPVTVVVADVEGATDAGGVEGRGGTTQSGGPAGLPAERPGIATAPAHPNCENVSSLVIVPPSRNIATLLV